MSADQAVVDGATPGRVERKRGRRIQEILTAAAELFGARGYDAVSLEDVADRLDVTKGSLYYYFASKDELVTAAIETLGNDWTARLEALPAGGSATDRLRALVRAHIDIAVKEYPAALRLFLAPQDWPSAQQARIKQLRRGHDRLFRALVEEGLASGEFAVTALDPTLQCMHAAMSQTPAWCAHLAGRARERAIDSYTATVLMLVGVHPTPAS
ncbi:MAG TPA: TetR/AcrR family transcriptional regulator [Blastococcus sp.]|jgi:AcrR family transcriptional regulator|nr:TetR/AcrR family transcriptional regulator [Blastococcus sp.]